jgi:RNA polymerase sigma factor (sigma-70 family)
MANLGSSSKRQLIQYYDELLDYVSLKIGNRQLANDVVQETYLRVCQKPEQFVGLRQPIAFLKTVSIHIAFDFLKKDKNYNKYFDSIDEQDIDNLPKNIELTELSEQELGVVRDEYTQQILKKISGLPPVCRDVFLLVQFYGMTQVEVAKQLGISRTMVIKHFTRALEHFSEIFEDE